jgi:hypothetical protein
MLSCLIYTSHRASTCDDREIQAIVKAAQKSNANSEMTGVLLYSATRFIQVLEGEGERLSDLYARIKQDKRHSEVKLVSLTKIKERVFPSWRMGSKEIGTEITFMQGTAPAEITLFNEALQGKAANSEALAVIINKLFF